MAVLSYNILGNYLNPTFGVISVSSSSTAFTISLSSDTGFTDTLSVTYANSYIFTTIYVKFVPIEVTDYTGNVNHIVLGSNISKNLIVMGSVPLPTLLLNPAALKFDETQISTTSTVLLYTLSAAHLVPSSGVITLNSPSGFQISTLSGSGFSSSSTISYSGKTLIPTLVYVRFIPILEQSYSGSITHSGGGAATQNVSVSGNGVTAAATARYWVGGSGNWSDATNHWALVSGGAPGAANLPNSGLDVFIDVNSGFASGGTIIEDGITTQCKDFTANSGHNFTIEYGASDLTIFGSAIFESGMTMDSIAQSYIYMSGSGSNTITINNAQIYYFYVDGSGTFTLQDNLICSSRFSISNGIFNANGKDVSANVIAIVGNATVMMGSGTWHITGLDGTWLVDTLS